MSTAVAARHWQAAWTTPTVRRFAWAVAIALGVLAFGGFLYLAEKFILQPPRRFVENPGSVMMRAGGLAHFCMGWLYLFTSPRIRNPFALFRLSGLLLVGIALCLVSAQLGGLSNRFLYLLFFCYFLVHEIRDERDLYQASGDAPNENHNANNFLQALTLTATLGMTAVISIGYLLYGVLIKKRPLLVSCPWYVYAAMALGVCALLWWTGWRCGREASRYRGGLVKALNAHSPLVAVFAGLLTVILLGGVLGSLSFNLIILIHGGTWITFVYHRLQKQPAPTPRNVWTWLRGTPTGFLFLHAAVFLFILTLMALRVYVWERTGFISELVERSSFPYWSIMHITLAFWRPR